MDLAAFHRGFVVDIDDSRATVVGVFPAGHDVEPIASRDQRDGDINAQWLCPALSPHAGVPAGRHSGRHCGRAGHPESLSAPSLIVSRALARVGSVRGGTVIEIGGGSLDFGFRPGTSPRDELLAEPEYAMRRGELVELTGLVEPPETD